MDPAAKKKSTLINIPKKNRYDIPLIIVPSSDHLQLEKSVSLKTLPCLSLNIILLETKNK